MAKKNTKFKKALQIVAGVTFAFAMWLFWRMMAEWIGNVQTAFLWALGISALFFITGYLSSGHLVDKFS